MPASAEKVFEVGLQFEQAVSLVKQILPGMSAVIAESDEQAGTFVANKDPSAKSWGETIRVQIEPVPDRGSRIRFASQSTSETTVTDLGVNDENVAAFERNLTLNLSKPTLIAQPSPSEASSPVIPQAAPTDLTAMFAPQSNPQTYAPPINPPSYAQQSRALKDRSIALILEILPGLFGFLGFGWLYSSNTTAGMVWFGGMLVWDLIAIVVVVLTAGFGCLCTVPISLALTGLSAFTLNAYTKEHPELFGS